jgi:hypothetical protein
MPRRKSLTRRFLQHVFLISLARTVLTVAGRGRAWDEWDDRGEEPQPAPPRRGRFAQSLTFTAIFFAGLALSAGAGNEVRSLLEDDSSSVAAQGATGPTGPTGTSGVLAPAAAPEQPRQAYEQAAPAQVSIAGEREAVAKPVATQAPGTRTAVAAERPSHASLRSGTATAAPKRTAIARTRSARPHPKPSRPHGKRKAPTAKQAPKAAPLDPEVNAAAGHVVWLNRAAPDPTPPAARLRLPFARELVAYSRLAHVDWALVLATLRAEGNNGRSPAGRRGLRTLSFRLAAYGGRTNAWGAALAYSSDTTVADRVVALRHYYRAVGLASLVHGLLSQKADLQDRVLHDSRLRIYAGGRADVAAGRVDVRVLALMLYLAETYREVTVSCLVSGHGLYARPGVVSAHIYGRAIDIAAVRGVSITGHQQPGGLTEQAVRSILMLPGGMLPAQVISLLGLGGPSFPLANHYDHIHVGY